MFDGHGDIARRQGVFRQLRNAVGDLAVFFFEEESFEHRGGSF
jgi:hypothetical protein